MPDGLPLFADPEHFDMENELDRFARAIFAHQSGIALGDLDAWFHANPSQRDEFLALKESHRRPGWVDSGVRIFEVTESPEGEMKQHGRSYAIVRSYAMRYIPNRKPITILTWNRPVNSNQ